MDPSPSNEGKSPRSYALSGKIMFSAIVVLFTVVLLILFLHLYVRWHVIRRASRRVRRRRRLVFSTEGLASAPCAVNRGLDPSILASLPVLLFSDYAGEDDESGECAVCLNEFKDGEKIRCLPRCGHRFHIDCIDMWFCSHSSCPLCRATVEVVKDAAATNSGTTQAVDTSAAPADTNVNELCSSCQRVEDMGSSSSDSSCRAARIEIPASRAEGSSAEEQQTSLGLESPNEHPLKTAISRMVLIRWLLMRDPRLYWGGDSGSVPDLERGDGVSPPSPPTTMAADPAR